MIKISNNNIAVEISALGAELHSIRNVDTGREYMWQGDAKYWTGHSPLLFPMCGKEWNGTFRMDGKDWPVEKHGFARRSEFVVVEQAADEVTLALESNEELLAIFPRSFRLCVTYKLNGSSLYVTWQIKNTGIKAMPFQIGAHPAFQLPDWHECDDVHGYLSFNVRDRLMSDALTSKGYRSATESAFEVTLDEMGRLPLTNSTFDCDTILDSRGIVNEVTLYDKASAPFVRMRFDMPVMALWSPNGGCAPFVCIEPWCGCCDYEEYKGLFADRDIVNSLLSGEVFHNTYIIELFA